MSLTINSDLVVGVLQAGSPSRISAATRTLAAAAAQDFGRALLAAENSIPSPGGDLVLDVIAAADPVKKQTAELRLMDRTPEGKLAAFQKFEALLLSNAFDNVLPENESGAFGEGFAGGVWRSMAAEQFASLFTARGGIGIAEMLAQQLDSGDAFPQANRSMGQWPYFETKAISAYQT